MMKQQTLCRFFFSKSSFLNSLLWELFYFRDICLSSCKQVLLNEIFLVSAKLRGHIFSPVLMHHIFHKIEKKICEQNFINQNLLEMQNLGFWFYTINWVKCRKPSFPNAPAIIFYLPVYVLPWEDCVCAKSLQSCPTLCDPMGCSPPGSSVHGDSPGRSTGVGCHALLQGIFLTQGSNPRRFRLWLWQVGSLPLAPPGKPLGGELLHFLTIIVISLRNPSCCCKPACLKISFNVKSVTQSDPEIFLQKKINHKVTLCRLDIGSSASLYH